MIFKSESDFLKSGIYKITNTSTNRIYIGQAKTFKHRWKNHYGYLCNGKHSNKFLQRDYDKCKEKLGHDDFLVFEILELMENSTREQRNEREQYWINKFYDGKAYCYNIERTINHPGISMFSKTPNLTRIKKASITKNLWTNPDFRKKMEVASTQKSIIMKKVCSNKEYKERHKEVMRRKWSDPKYKARVSAAIKKQAEENPDKLIKQSKRMKKIWSDPVFKEKRAAVLKASYDARLTKPRAIIIDPDGKEHEVFNIKRFAEEHGLNRRSLNDLILGECSILLGWTLKGRQKKISRLRAIVVDPNGVTHEVRNTKEFAVMNNLNLNSLRALIRGDCSTLFGWSLKERIGKQQNTVDV